jgi:lysophospholipase L1-like esterase
MAVKASYLDQVPRLVLGAVAAEPTELGVALSRLPHWVGERLRTDPMLPLIAANGSGVRLEFKTKATNIRLGLILTQIVYGELMRFPASVVALVDGVESEYRIEEEGNTFNPIDPSQNQTPNQPSIIELQLQDSAAQKSVEIWLPHNRAVVISELSADAALEPVEVDVPRWVHYGSSISHCVEADSPLGVWPVIAAKKLSLSLYNLGIAGEAQLDQFAARTIRDLAPDFISMKIGINTVNANSLNARTFPHALHGFLDTIRDTLPNVPILISTAIFCPPHEEGYGPTLFDFDTAKAVASPKPVEMFPRALTLTMTRALVQDVVSQRAASDKNLYLMSGLDLFSEADAHDLPDDLHPNPEGYRRMGERFASHETVMRWLGRAK